MALVIVIVATGFLVTLVAIIQQLHFDLPTSLTKAFVSTWIEMFSETLGESFVAGGRFVKSRAFRQALKRAPRFTKAAHRLMQRLAKTWIGKGKGRTASQFSRLLKRGEFQGIIPEFLEERAGDELRALFGIDPRQKPSLKQWGAEIVAFAVPAAGGAVSNVIAGREAVEPPLFEKISQFLAEPTITPPTAREIPETAPQAGKVVPEPAQKVEAVPSAAKPAEAVVEPVVEAEAEVEKLTKVVGGVFTINEQNFKKWLSQNPEPSTAGLKQKRLELSNYLFQKFSKIIPAGTPNGGALRKQAQKEKNRQLELPENKKVLNEIDALMVISKKRGWRFKKNFVNLGLKKK